VTRTLFGLAALIGGSYLATSANPPKIPVPTIPDAGQRDVDPQMPLFRTVAKACDDCARACDTCSAHCVQLLADGRKEHLATMQTCQDCAEVCSLAARVIAKDGPMGDLTCTACAEACKRCGDACEKFGSDPLMKKCADECARCEKACRELLKIGGPATPKSK